MAETRRPEMTKDGTRIQAEMMRIDQNEWRTQTVEGKI